LASAAHHEAGSAAVLWRVAAVGDLFKPLLANAKRVKLEGFLK